MTYRIGYALKEYIRSDFCGGRYEIFDQQGQRLRHSVAPFGYRPVGWEEMKPIVAVVAVACRRRGSGFPDEEESVRASITGRIVFDQRSDNAKGSLYLVLSPVAWQIPTYPS